MHTPGPWTAGASMVSTWTREKQDNGERIVEIALVRENRGLGPLTPAEYKANVALIAAAPELLAALHRAADLHKALSDTGLFDELAATIHPDEINATCDAVSAAIARAEGRT